MGSSAAASYQSISPDFNNTVKDLTSGNGQAGTDAGKTYMDIYGTVAPVAKKGSDLIYSPIQNAKDMAAQANTTAQNETNAINTQISDAATQKEQQQQAAAGLTLRAQARQTALMSGAPGYNSTILTSPLGLPGSQGSGGSKQMIGG